MNTTLSFSTTDSENDTEGKKATLVDEIVQFYSADRTPEMRVLEFVERLAETEHEKLRLIKSFPEYKQILYFDSLFDEFKKELFGTNKKGCMLTFLELATCYLICNDYYPEVIADILWVEKEELKKTVLSLEGKMASYGKLPPSYIKNKQTVHSFFKAG